MACQETCDRYLAYFGIEKKKYWAVGMCWYVTVHSQIRK